MRLLVVLLMFLVGCAQTLPISASYNGLTNTSGVVLRWCPEDFPLHVYVDVETSYTRQVALQAAAERWNREVGFQVFEIEHPSIPYWRYHEDSQATVYVSSWDLSNSSHETNFIVQGQVFPNSTPSGHYISAVLAIDKNAPDNIVTLVYLHELGHILALGHDSDRASIMFPHLNESYANIMENDLNFIREEMGHGNSTNTQISAQQSCN